MDKYLERFDFDIKMFDQALSEFVDAYNNLLKEVEELREYKKNATRKHWQEQSANNYLNWRMAENKIEDIKEFIYYNIIDGELDLNKRGVIELKELLEKPAHIEMLK